MNKIALVTGGSRGIGKVIAKILKENDFTVIITSRNKERLKKTAKELRVDYFKADVSNLKEVQNLIKYIAKKYKKIDVLVNNAGVVSSKKLIDDNYEDIDNTIKTNVLGVIYCTKESLPYMKDGIIINISSVAGLEGYNELSVYCASKFAVVGFGEALKKELKDNKIYTICPGPVDTDMWKQYEITPGTKPEDVAKIVIGITKNKYKNGKIIKIYKNEDLKYI